MNIQLKEVVEKELKMYNWEYEYIINEHCPFYDVIFPYVIIEFYYNSQYRSIDCSFYDINDDTLIKNTYGLSELLNLNKIDTPGLYNEYSSVSIEEYIKQYVKYIHKNLMYLVRGEFESFKSYTALKKNTSYPLKKG